VPGVLAQRKFRPQPPNPGGSTARRALVGAGSAGPAGVSPPCPPIPGGTRAAAGTLIEKLFLGEDANHGLPFLGGRCL